ncbi:MAG: hypothetical protein ABJB34_03215 [Acidobacteriota bacterium]
MRSNLLKVLFVIALLCPAVFADGDMGSGGFADSGAGPATVKTPRSFEDGDMGNTWSSRTSLDSMLSSIYEYLDSMI